MASVNFWCSLLYSWCISKTSSSLCLVPHQQDQCYTVFVITELTGISSIIMVALSRSVWYINDRRYSLISKCPGQVQSRFSLCETCGGQGVATIGLSWGISVFHCWCVTPPVHKTHSLCVVVVATQYGQVSLNGTLKESSRFIKHQVVAEGLVQEDCFVFAMLAHLIWWASAVR
jgi:hypothetical protein